VGKFEGSHAVRVEKLAVGLGQTMNLGKSELKDLHIAGLLHDIGQFGMPEKVRNSAPWGLMPEERKIYETYSTIGALLLSEIRGIEDVVPIVEHHTEHYDGSGFPTGLNGADIPLGARILAVADGYETSVRFGQEDGAIEYLAKHKGSLYDPAIVNLTINYIRSNAAKIKTERRMTSVRVAELQEGQELADAILDDRGIMLVGANRKLTAQAVEKVRKLVPDQVVSVYLDDPEPEESTLEAV
jgi:response regulator RpfG family c-di-GMP phosphodiesterase